MTSEKIIGYFLLAVGIVSILASTYSVFLVFTGKQRPPSVFSFEVPGVSLPSLQSSQFELPQGLDLPEGFSLPENFSPETKTETTEIKIFSDKLVNDMVNMSVFLLLMMFITQVEQKSPRLE